MNTALTPAQTAAEELCPLSSDKPIALVWKRDAAILIVAQYRPLLELARDTLIEFSEHFQTTKQDAARALANCDPEKESRYMAIRDAAEERENEADGVIAAIAHALGEKSS